jgi:urease accessory protein
MISYRNAPELAPYLDEPAQLPSGSFGKQALLRLRFEPRADRSILAFMERKAPLLVQRALYCDEGMPGLPVVTIISNAGGILQGDRYRIEIESAAGSVGHVTTQAATKIHEMDANHATQDQSITLHEDAYLEYIPDQIIPFRRSRFLTRTRITAHPTATLLYSEILVGGRIHYDGGELFLFDLFSSDLRASRPDGRELFAEKFILDPLRSPLSILGVMGNYPIFGNVVLLTPKTHADAVFDSFSPPCNLPSGLASGIGRLPHDAGLIFKVLGHDTTEVRRAIRSFWTVVRLQVAGFAVPPEFPWR